MPGALVNVATLPFGRKSIVPPWGEVSKGNQLIVAVLDPIVIVSVESLVAVRMTAPVLPIIWPRNAPAGDGIARATAGLVARTAVAQARSSALLRRARAATQSSSAYCP